MKARWLVAALTCAGCAVVVKAATVPFAEFCEAASYCAVANHLPSLVNDENYGVSWWILVPTLAVVLAIAAAVGVILARSRFRSGIAAGTLSLSGVVIFGFYQAMEHVPGRMGFVGVAVGGVLIALAGLIAAIVTATLRPPSRPMAG